MLWIVLTKWAAFYKYIIFFIISAQASAAVTMFRATVRVLLLLYDSLSKVKKILYWLTNLQTQHGQIFWSFFQTQALLGQAKNVLASPGSKLELRIRDKKMVPIKHSFLKK